MTQIKQIVHPVILQHQIQSGYVLEVTSLQCHNSHHPSLVAIQLLFYLVRQFTHYLLQTP